jgi:hypothetical protein
MLKYCLKIIFAILFLFCTTCAFLEHPIITLTEDVKLNTKRKPFDYDMIEKAEYRNYLHYKKATDKEKEKEILKRMDETK